MHALNAARRRTLDWTALWGLAFLLSACGGSTPTSADSQTQATPPASANSGLRSGEFEIQGHRTLQAESARVLVLKMAELPLFEKDHPGLLLQLRQKDLKASQSARVEIFPLPDPPHPGTYPLVSALQLGEGALAASIIIPKKDEKVFLPMAIYGEGISGSLTLQETSDGTLQGSFEIHAQLDVQQADPHVTATGSFAGIKIPNQAKPQ